SPWPWVVLLALSCCEVLRLARWRGRAFTPNPGSLQSAPEQGLRDVAGDRRIVVELHGVDGPAFGRGAQRRRVAEHLRQWNVCGDHLHSRPRLHVQDLAASGGEVADHVPHERLRSDDFGRHDRLEQDAARLPGALLETDRAGDLERHLVRVHLVVAAVEELHLEVDHGVAREHAALHRLLYALADCGDVLLRDGAALDLVEEFEPAPLRSRADVQPDVAVLTSPAALADVLALGLHFLGDGFAVGDLRLADVGVDLVLAPHAVDDDVEMELAHSGDHSLAVLLIGADAE